MSASAADLADLRRMVAEPTTTTYGDGDLTAVIEKYPVPDAADYEPTLSDGLTVNDLWTATYDLNAAAAQVWDEKASTLAATAYDFAADGGDYKREQVYKHAVSRAQHFASRAAVGSLVLRIDEKAKQTTSTPFDNYVVNWIENDEPLSEP